MTEEMQIGEKRTVKARGTDDAPLKAMYGETVPDCLFRSVYARSKDDGVVELMCGECYESYTKTFKVTPTSTKDEYVVEYVKVGDRSFDPPEARIAEGWTQIY